MKTVKIDEKWSIEYDDEENCRPVRVLRYGGDSSFPFAYDNAIVALFYAFLDLKKG